MIRFRFVDEHRGAYGVKRICRVLEIDRSTYYDHLARAESRKARAVAEDELAQEIAEIHAASGGAYGAIRVTRELRARGRVVNKKRVARIMKERGIAGITRRKRKSLTKADKKAPPAPDLIRRDFTAVMPGIRLVGDITYLPTSEGWLYLATVIDLCTREVVGWSMAEHMRASLVIDAVRMAHAAGRVEGNAIFHSDRGSQGGFNRSSQHPDSGGARWAGTRGRSRCLEVRGGSGRQTGHCVRRCVRRGGLSPRALCSGSFGG